MSDESFDDENLGPPVEELLLLDAGAPDGFVQRILGSIQRRLFVGHVVDFGTRPFGALFLEYLVMLLGLFTRVERTNNGSHDES